MIEHVIAALALSCPGQAEGRAGLLYFGSAAVERYVGDCQGTTAPSGARPAATGSLTGYLVREQCPQSPGDGLSQGTCHAYWCPAGGVPYSVSAVSGGQVVSLPSFCAQTGPTATPPALSAADLQREFATKLIHRPTLHLQPDPTATPMQVALVNGPVAATVAPYDPQAAELHVTVPTPATIRATPATTVDWGDGTTSTGTGTLTHTYRHRGTVAVTAATTWQGAWWPDADPAATTPLQAITLTTAQSLEVHEAHSSLVAG